MSKIFNVSAFNALPAHILPGAQVEVVDCFGMLLAAAGEKSGSPMVALTGPMTGKGLPHGTPDRIRTGVTTLKGWDPRPLDDGG